MTWAARGKEYECAPVAEGPFMGHVCVHVTVWPDEDSNETDVMCIAPAEIEWVDTTPICKACGCTA